MRDKIKYTLNEWKTNKKLPEGVELEIISGGFIIKDETDPEVCWKAMGSSNYDKMAYKIYSKNHDEVMERGVLLIGGIK